MLRLAATLRRRWLRCFGLTVLRWPPSLFVRLFDGILLCFDCHASQVLSGIVMNRLSVWLIAQAATLVSTLLRVLLVLVFVGRHVLHPSFPFFPGAVCALLPGLQPPLFTAISLVRLFRLNAPISICRNRFGFATFLRLARRAIDLRLLDVTRLCWLSHFRQPERSPPGLSPVASRLRSFCGWKLGGRTFFAFSFFISSWSCFRF